MWTDLISMTFLLFFFNASSEGNIFCVLLLTWIKNTLYHSSNGPCMVNTRQNQGRIQLNPFQGERWILDSFHCIFTIEWTMQCRVTGYEIQYCTDVRCKYWEDRYNIACLWSESEIKSSRTLKWREGDKEYFVLSKLHRRK